MPILVDAAVMARPRTFDVYGLSAVALGLNTLLVAGLARMLFRLGGGDPIGPLLLLGVTKQDLMPKARDDWRVASVVSALVHLGIIILLIVGRAMLSGARFLGVRRADLPGEAPLAAILRYPI